MKKFIIVASIVFVLCVVFTGIGLYIKCSISEYVPISTSGWTVVKNDPEKQWIGWEIVGPWKYWVEIDGDSKNAVLLPSPKGEINLPAGSVYRFRLDLGQKAKKSKLRLVRGNL